MGLSMCAAAQTTSATKVRQVNFRWLRAPATTEIALTRIITEVLSVDGTYAGAAKTGSGIGSPLPISSVWRTRGDPEELARMCLDYRGTRN